MLNFKFQMRQHPKSLPLSEHFVKIVLFLLFLLSGWQFQQSPPTIQCIMEKTLIRVTRLERKDLLLVGASRTDTGVHAWGQV